MRAVEHDLDGGRVDPVFLDENPRRQRLFRVLVVDRHRGLEHDGPRVEAGGDEAHGCARDLHTVIERLALAVQPRKSVKGR
jgi:hypothetical protein